MPLSEWTFVVAAYAVTWIGLLGYAAYLEARRRHARREWDRTDARTDAAA
ncbi:MAG: CcmD family protein [Longimicrobiales bacterium]